MSEPTPQNGTQAFTPSPQFLARQKRIDDALNLRKPDRVPVAPLIYTFYPTRTKGISNREAMYNMDKTYRVWKETTLEYDWDAAPPPGSLRPARPMEIMGMTQMKWPGNGLPDNQPFQWVEGEYMRQDEYDEVLADPNGFAIKKLWPRISNVLGPISGMSRMLAPPLLLFLSTTYTLPGVLGGMFSAPPMIDLLKKMLELTEAERQTVQAGIDYSREMMRLGYPLLWGSVTFTAFDHISDCFRGMKGSMLDMYKLPDKLLAMVEMFTPLTIGSTIMQAQQTGNKGVFIPMHRGAAGFMSDKQFAKFYWPSFRALILGIIDAGLTPVPLIEGNYTPRLEYFKELPAKKILAHWDIVDRKKTKEVLGDTMCFWGNVPASLMCTGTPQQVKDDVKELIDIFGDNGGLIIDSSMGIPDESKPENVRALVEAAHEYGKY